MRIRMMTYNTQVSALALGVLVLSATVRPAAARCLNCPYKVLYAFTGGADGSEPTGTLINDSSGNLYGTTSWQ